jgi:glucose-6-phosphate 1-dehydrogenase
VKRPGPEMVSMPAELSAVKKSHTDEIDAYERLLTDAMNGDSLLFVREDAVEAAWAIVDRILGNVTPLHEYEPGTWGPSDAERLAADIGGWHNPEPFV